MLSLFALAVLVVVHLVAHRLTFLRNAPRSRSLSFAAGVSLAYVFVHLLPELAHGQHLLGEQVERMFVLDELAIYILALAGLLAFYGLERLLHRDPDVGETDSGEVRAAEGGAEDHPLFWLHLAVFAVYSLIVGCLLVHQPSAPAYEDSSDAATLLVFTLAMALHFVVVDFGLRSDFPSSWRRIGRWVMSGALVLGWLAGTLLGANELFLLLITALLGGGILLNVLKEELPRDRDAHFGWLLAGAGSYLAVLAVA